MTQSLSDRDWLLLLRRIRDGKCTPFLGAGACYGTLPLGSDIARQWAAEYGYPMQDTGDLTRVAQYLAVSYDPMFPKEEILSRYICSCAPPDFTQPDEPHGVLADLPLPIYVTTNYDSFMVKALEYRHKDPKREVCLWNKYLEDQPSLLKDQPDFEPTPANPVVFHLHGHDQLPESLVLTWDDYLDFLVHVSHDAELLPHQIQKALTGTSLIFVGYSLQDWSFRVLFRGLIMAMESSLRRISVTVQLPPPEAGEGTTPERVQDYLDQYFERMEVRVYWGTAREFLAELHGRWEGFSDGA